MKNRNQKGQALLESLFCLPTLLAGSSLALVGLHGLIAHYLFDHWTYQAALCLAREQSVPHCRQKFVERASMVSFTSFQVLTLQRDRKQVRVNIQLTSPLSNKTISQVFDLPLTSAQFGESQ